MKAWDRLVVVAAAVLLALVVPAGAAASRDVHPRHVEFRPPSSRGSLYLGEHDGYEFAISFGEPDFAILYADSFDRETEDYVSTAYGAHFEGSLARGRIRARFGSVGSVSVRFVSNGKGRSRDPKKNCEGRGPREEYGDFVGHIVLHGEGDYSGFAARRAEGDLSRTFRLRCRVGQQAPPRPTTSLREAVEPLLTFGFGGGSGGSLALLEAGDRQGGRTFELFARHTAGAPAGAEVTARAFEYQGTMPVGRGAAAPESPAGTLLTSLPGEHPATATLTPAAPFSGEATYLASSHIAHSWTGDLAVQFPGLLQPLAGPGFYSSLCVVSPLRTRYGCDFLPPNLQVAE